MFEPMINFVKVTIPFLFKKETIVRTASSLFLTGLTTVSNIIGPILLVKSFEELDKKSDPASSSESSSDQMDPVLLVGLFGIAFGLMRTLPVFRRMLLDPVNTQLSSTIARQIVEKVYELDLNKNNLNAVKSVPQSVGKAYLNMDKLYRGLLATTIPSGIDAIAMTVVIYREYGPVGLTFTGTWLLHNILTFINAAPVVKAKEDRNNADYTIYYGVVAATANYRNAHLFGNESKELKNFTQIRRNYNAIRDTESSAIDAGSILPNLISNSILAGMLAYTAYEESKNDDYEEGGLVLFSLYMMQMSYMLMELSTATNQVYDAYINLKEVVDFLEKQPTIFDQPGAKSLSLTPQTANIEFNNVSFAYPAEVGVQPVPVLTNVSFVAPAGKTTAIVGLSGSGKSTITELLNRFYEVQAGEIKIGGHDIRHIKLRSLRKSIALVEQDPALFKGSVHDNVAYGNKSATSQTIQNALQYAGLKPEHLSDGYNTDVGDNGVKLSGGQLQRVAVARALIKGAPIMILDEVTASLDIEKEKEIQENLAIVTKGKTTIVITHRLNTIVNADNIIFIENGVIIEQGNYKDLMNISNGRFKALYELYLQQTQANNSNATSSTVAPLITIAPYIFPEAESDDEDEEEQEQDDLSSSSHNSPSLSPLLGSKRSKFIN